MGHIVNNPFLIIHASPSWIDGQFIFDTILGLHYEYPPILEKCELYLAHSVNHLFHSYVPVDMMDSQKTIRLIVNEIAFEFSPIFEDYNSSTFP